MTRDETVALFLECEARRAEARAAALAGKSEAEVPDSAHEVAKAHWNAWAEALLAERKALEERGLWAVQNDPWGSLKPKNAETRAWIKRAEADFSRCLFLIRGPEGLKETAEDRDKPEAETPPIAPIRIDNDYINMGGFVFPGRTLFARTTFQGDTSFDSASFKDFVQFARATFQGTAVFNSATFSGAASFVSVTFLGYARFANATFRSGAGFASATFRSYTNFSQAEFGGDASFAGVKVERAFTMTGAVFIRVPAFNQANFAQAPDLDDVKFPLPRFLRASKKDLIAQYRALRRMAIQGSDYEREQMAFKGEIRSKRGTDHRWYHAAFWYGLAYDALSDFGRSMSRPSLAWLLSIGVFALFFLVSAGKLESAFADCTAAGAPNYESALVISWKNALPLLGDAKAEEVARTCLYGAAAYRGAAIQGIQKVWSALLLFLFLLAVRNQFKIK